MTARDDDRPSWLPREYEAGLASVVIPTFNRAGIVDDTVRSVMRQSWRPLEIIVADDGSTDDTLGRMEQLARECDDGLTLKVSRGEKGGACVSRNRGARESRGEFLMFLDSDDLLTPRAIELLAGRARESGADMAWGPWRRMHEHADRCELSAPVTRDFDGDWMVEFLGGGYIATCAILYHRDVLHRIEGWREDLVLDGDYCFNAELGAAGAKLAGISDVTSYYRQGAEGQMSGTDYAVKARQIRRVLRMLEERLVAIGRWTPARRGAVAWRYFYTAREVWIHSGDRDAFVELTREARRVDPGFRPPNRGYALIAKLAGYRAAEHLADLRRRWHA